MIDVPHQYVQNYEGMKEWLSERERFAAVALREAKKDGRHQYARELLESTGEARLAAVANMQAGLAWDNGAVRYLLATCELLQLRAESLVISVQRNKASRSGAEKVSAGFDKAGFQTEAAKLKPQGLHNTAIATRLASKFDRSPEYLRKLLPE